MKHFYLRILAADEDFFEGECESLMIPAVDGQYGILAGHSNMVSAISTGILTYRQPGGENQVAAVSGGLIKIENNTALVLLNSAERPEEIDIARAQREADEARERLLSNRSLVEYSAAQATLARAMSRLRLVNQIEEQKKTNPTHSAKPTYRKM